MAFGRMASLLTQNHIKQSTMKAIFKAISDFQKEVPVIHKGTTGYGYNYADLVTIFEKDRKSTRLNSSHVSESRMPSSA